MNRNSSPGRRRSESPHLPGPGAPASGEKTPPLRPGVIRSPALPVRASRTPGVTRATACAAFIGRSMDGSDAQVHNSISHIILEL